MMQPVDVRSTHFGKGLFGYKKVDVDTYVETVYRAYDEAYNEVEKLREENGKLQNALEEYRTKIHDLEAQLRNADSNSGKKKADDKKAVKKPAESADKKTSEKTSESETSKFFNKQAEEETPVFGGDDDEVFVGEIEDNRKPNKVMIGDGEEEGADDFEFL
ncbi:MAG: DivIVA domain-containing protein [Eubacterium sp.]|nr:DivIVA domain-containing protein [Eubacterium sp.]